MDFSPALSVIGHEDGLWNETVWVQVLTSGFTRWLTLGSLPQPWPHPELSPFLYKITIKESSMLASFLVRIKLVYLLEYLMSLFFTLCVNDRWTGFDILFFFQSTFWKQRLYFPVLLQIHLRSKKKEKKVSLILKHVLNFKWPYFSKMSDFLFVHYIKF